VRNTLGRRDFLRASAAVAAGTGVLAGHQAQAVQPAERAGPSLLKLSCCAYSFRKYLSGKDKSWSLQDFIARGAEWGLDGVELTSYYFAEATASYCHQLRRTCFLLGLDVSGTAIGNTFAVPPGKDRDAQIARTEQWVDLAVEMGAPCLRVFGGSVPKGASVEEATQWTIDSLQAAAAHAGERGIYLALENHGGVTASAGGVLQILQAVESEWVGANLDTGNFHSQDPYEEIAQVAPYAVNVHLKAEVRAKGQRAQPTDFARIAGILGGVNYRGYLSLEYESAEEPLTAVPRLLTEIRGAIG
jgi:sugar phosphate isomerase/epimerase